MGDKRTSSHLQVEPEKKKTDESSRPVVPQFGDHEYRARYRCLIDQRFVEECKIDWSTIEKIGLADEVQDLISMQGWDLFFDIDELTYCELTMEVMSSLKLHRTIIILNHRENISFQMFGVGYIISYTEFSWKWGLSIWSTLA